MKKYFVPLILFVTLYMFVVFLNNYPTYNASKKIPKGFFYTGHAAWFDPWDLNVYLSTIRYGQKHGFLLKNVYTTNKNKPIIMYPAYTLLGMMFPRNNIFQLYFNFQLVVIFIILIAILYSSFIFLDDIKMSFGVVLLTAVSRGYGWILDNKLLSPNIFLSGFSFRSAFQRPHEGLGIILYILALTYLYSFLVQNKKSSFIISFFLNLLLLFFYPYYYLVYFFVFLFFLFIINKSGSKFFPLFLSTLVLGISSILYYLSISNSAFASSLVEKQPLVSLVGLMVGYGVLLIIYIFSFLTLKNNKKNYPSIFLTLWVFLSLALSYLPIGYSRFFLRALYFPLTMISFITLRNLVYQKKINKILAITIVIFLFVSTIPTSFYIFYKRINVVNLVNQKNIINIWYFLPINYLKAFQFLNKLPDDGILSSYYIGNHIPVYTDKSVYLGHLAQTPNATDKNKKMHDFFSNKYLPEEAKTFLIKNNINYIFYGDQEKTYGKMDYDFIKMIYSNKNVSIFKIIK